MSLPTEVAAIFTNHGASFTFLTDGRSFSLANDHPNYARLKEALRGPIDAAELRRLVDIPRAVQEYTIDRVTIRNGAVYFQGEVMGGGLCQRILGLMNEGLPHEPLCKFLDRLMENPSRRAVQELYPFLEHKDIPIDTDGYILAYKALRADWLDVHSGTVDNHPGCRPTLPRNQVDDNWGVQCSEGLHVGSIAYVRDFVPANGKTVIVRVDPKDVVSVPSDSSCQKMRVCTYEVLCEYTGDLTRQLYRSQGTAEPIPVAPGNAPYNAPDDEITYADCRGCHHSFDEDELENGLCYECRVSCDGCERPFANTELTTYDSAYRYCRECRKTCCPNCHEEDEITLSSGMRVCRACDKEWDPATGVPL